jgi:predicted MPP superfamily phosphohydrolase
MNRTIFFLILSFVLIFIDWYVWQGIRIMIRNLTPSTQRWIGVGYWGFTIVTLIAYFGMQVLPPDLFSKATRTFILAFIAIPYLCKLLTVILLFVDDMRRLGTWVVGLTRSNTPETHELAPLDEVKIPRSAFLATTAVAAGATLMGTFAFGIISGAHDYRIRRVRVPLKNLPRAFHGIKIAQLSDIHSGSFFNKTAVKGGVEMLMNEKPDLVFFTGDLVNDRAVELNDYINIFNKVKAPLGVHSVLGNHDYGDYYDWSSPAAKVQNLKDLKQGHTQMGWNLMINENKPIRVDNEEIGLIGIENWGAGNFAKYGKMKEAYQGSEDYPVKLLLSHDPSHWREQVLPDYGQIDIAFAGHTHGMQFGVELGSFKWSPAQYRYQDWAGLYQEGEQFLYVNRGYGYIGYPGRVGILPEITIMELVKA